MKVSPRCMATMFDRVIINLSMNHSTLAKVLSREGDDMADPYEKMAEKIYEKMTYEEDCPTGPDNPYGEPRKISRTRFLSNKLVLACEGLESLCSRMEALNTRLGGEVVPPQGVVDSAAETDPGEMGQLLGQIVYLQDLVESLSTKLDRTEEIV